MLSRIALLAGFLAFALLSGCTHYGGETLYAARKGFQTKIVRQEDEREAPPAPPKGLFDLVQYPSPVGKLPAYLTTTARDGGKKRPAIIWITGGDCNSIGEVWGPAERENDQSARQFRQAGVVMMFPSLRGGNLSPGRKESFWGEVDDILAAADFLAKQPGVDPKRIFLGGHSTGGTMVLIVAECADRFRAVFSFGPVADAAGYGGQFMTCEQSPQELRLRSPGYWLKGIRTPTFVFEGDQEGNGDSLLEMKSGNKNDKVHFTLVPGYTHFSVLAAVNELLAQKVAADTGDGEFKG